MCQSKAAGGQRCQYADQLANVRHKARYKHRDDEYDMEREVDKAVTQWKKENPEMVKNHLPETQLFQTPPKSKPIPSSLKALLTDKGTTTVTGGDEAYNKATTEKAYEDYKSWHENLTREEENEVVYYSQYGYEMTNAMLRRSGIHDLLRLNPHRKGDWKERAVKNKTNLDSALSKVEKPEEPRKLYRYYKVPAGVTPTEFMEKYFTKGEGFTEKGFMSTSVDPELIMAHLHQESKGKKNAQFIVMEILTKQGGSLQKRAYSSSSSVQTMEKEYVLPRNMKFRIADVRKNQTFEFGSERKDLYSSFATSNSIYSKDMFPGQKLFRPGDKRKFPLIQLVDEQLIAETSE